jgi:hypothetical protein
LNFSRVVFECIYVCMYVCTYALGKLLPWYGTTIFPQVQFHQLLNIFKFWHYGWWNSVFTKHKLK